MPMKRAIACDSDSGFGSPKDRARIGGTADRSGGAARRFSRSSG